MPGNPVNTLRSSPQARQMSPSRAWGSNLQEAGQTLALDFLPRYFSFPASACRIYHCPRVRDFIHQRLGKLLQVTASGSLVLHQAHGRRADMSGMPLTHLPRQFLVEGTGPGGTGPILRIADSSRADAGLAKRFPMLEKLFALVAVGTSRLGRFLHDQVSFTRGLQGHRPESWRNISSIACRQVTQNCMYQALL